MKKTIYTVTKDKKVQKETFSNNEKTSTSIVTDPKEYSEYIEPNMLNEGTTLTIEETTSEGTTTITTKLNYITDKGEKGESTSTATSSQTTTITDSKGKIKSSDPNEELLKKIKTRKISVFVEDMNGKKKVVKEIVRLDDDDKETYERFVLSDSDAKEYFNEEDLNVGSKIESKIEKENGIWMHTQTVSLKKKDGSFSSKTKSTSDLGEILDFEVNPSEKKQFENITRVVVVVENKNGKKTYKKITYSKNKEGKDIKKEEPITEKEAIEYFDEDDMDDGSQVEFTFEKDPNNHIESVKKVKSIITDKGEKKDPETNDNLTLKDVVNQMIINKRNTKKMEKENKPKDVKVIKNFYIIIDEVDGKPIAKRIFKGEDGNDFEEEFTEDMEKFIKNKDQILPGNKFEVAYQEEEYPIGKSTKVRVFTIVKNQKGEDERFDDGEELDDLYDDIDTMFEEPKEPKLKSVKKPSQPKDKNPENKKPDENEVNEDDEIPSDAILLKKTVYTVLPGKVVQLEVYNGTEKEPSTVEVLKNKKDYSPYLTNDILNLGTKCTKTEYDDGKGTIVTKIKTHFVSDDKSEGDKVETQVRSVQKNTSYKLPNEEEKPYHEKFPNNYIKIQVIDDNGKPKGVKVTKKFNEPYETIEELNDEDTKQYFPLDNLNPGSYIESKIEENENGVPMYSKVTHFVKPDGTQQTQSVSTSDLNSIFDEEINPSERKEYDNVSSVTFVIEDINGKKVYKKITRILNLNDGTETDITEEIPEEEIKKYFDDDEMENGSEIVFDFDKGKKNEDKKVKKVSKIKEKNGGTKEKVQENIDLKSVVNQIISNKKRAQAKKKSMEDEEKMYITINENKGKFSVKKVLIKEDELDKDQAQKLIGKNDKLEDGFKYEIVYDKKKKEMKKYKFVNNRRVGDGEVIPKEEWSIYEPLHSYINNQ
jgi:hypothetical protein